MFGGKNNCRILAVFKRGDPLNKRSKLIEDYTKNYGKVMS